MGREHVIHDHFEGFGHKEARFTPQHLPNGGPHQSEHLAHAVEGVLPLTTLSARARADSDSPMHAFATGLEQRKKRALGNLDRMYRVELGRLCDADPDASAAQRETYDRLMAQLERDGLHDKLREWQRLTDPWSDQYNAAAIENATVALAGSLRLASTRVEALLLQPGHPSGERARLVLAAMAERVQEVCGALDQARPFPMQPPLGQACARLDEIVADMSTLGTRFNSADQCLAFQRQREASLGALLAASADDPVATFKDAVSLAQKQHNAEVKLTERLLEGTVRDIVDRGVVAAVRTVNDGVQALVQRPAGQSADPARVQALTDALLALAEAVDRGHAALRANQRLTDAARKTLRDALDAVAMHCADQVHQLQQNKVLFDPGL